MGSLCVSCDGDSSDGAGVKRKEGEKLSNTDIGVKRSQIADSKAALLVSAFCNVDVNESSVTAKTAAEGSWSAYSPNMVVESRLCSRSSSARSS
jgi:hypothetical protein